MGDTACVAACLLVRAAANAAAATTASATVHSSVQDNGVKAQQDSGTITSTSAGAAACPVVIDPFCGQGTVLAVANELGMDALGVELSRKRCRQALKLRVLRAKDAPGLLR